MTEKSLSYEAYQEIYVLSIISYGTRFKSKIVDELDDWLTQPASFQTCVYVGANKTHFVGLVKQSLTMRIDRVCPAGQALAFDWVWDGHDMLREFSRILV